MTQRILPAIISQAGTECLPLTGAASQLLAIPASHVFSDGVRQITLEQLEANPATANEVFPHGPKPYVAIARSRYNDAVYTWDYVNDRNVLPILQTIRFPDLKDAGVTVIEGNYGYYNTYGIDAENAANEGLKYSPLLRRINGPKYESQANDSCAPASGALVSHTNDCRELWEEAWDWDNNNNASYVVDAIKSEMNLYVGRAGDAIYGWTYCIDDYMRDISIVYGDVQSRPKIDDLHKEIYSHDQSQFGTNRTVAEWCLSPFSVTGSSKYGYRYVSNFKSQRYYGVTVGDAMALWYSRKSYYMETKMMVDDVIWRPELNLEDYPLNTPRVLPLFYYGFQPYPVHWGANNIEMYTRLYVMHDFLAHLMGGGTGFTLFNWSNARDAYNVERPHWVKMREGMIDVYTMLTKHKVVDAAQWGNRSPDVPMAVNQTSGQTGWTVRCRQGWDAGDTFIEYPNQSMLTHMDIQFKSRRVIAAINSFPEIEEINWWRANNDGVSSSGAIPGTFLTWQRSTTRSWNPPVPSNSGIIGIEVTGFPEDGTVNQIQVTEILTGGDAITETDVTDQISNGKITRNLNPTQSVIYIVEPAAGYCGEGDPIPPCVETQEPGVHPSICFPRYWVDNDA